MNEKKHKANKNSSLKTINSIKHNIENIKINATK
jgi:hypothetical protein